MLAVLTRVAIAQFRLLFKPFVVYQPKSEMRREPQHLTFGYLDLQRQMVLLTGLQITPFPVKD